MPFGEVMLSSGFILQHECPPVAAHCFRNGIRQPVAGKPIAIPKRLVDTAGSIVSKAAEMLSRLLDGWTCFRQEWPAGWANLGQAFHRHSEKPPKRLRADRSGGFWASNDVISLIQDVIIPLWRYAL